MSADLAEEKQRLARAFERDTGVTPQEIRVVVSPYRVCPIGAHVDHQGGPVLGMALAAHSLLAFAPRDDGRVQLESENFDGVVEFELDATDGVVELELDATDGGVARRPDWGAYPCGAARVFAELAPGAARGFRGRLSGTLPGGGLSSSASVLLAFLSALASVNERALSPAELVRAARRVENEFVGVASGILDPASIVGARRGELLCIDTEEETWASSPLPDGVPAPAILVAFTGIARQLVHSGFNDRVGECHLAAEALLDASGRRRPAGRRARLGDLDDACFERFGAALPEALALRARHFFGERRRVREGLACWQRGDLAGFGERMFASCESSIHNYQTGSPELVALQQVLAGSPGVIGARFSGAGFGGCAVALIERATASKTLEHVRDGFARACPALREKMRVFVSESDDGLRIETPGGGVPS